MSPQDPTATARSLECAMMLTEGESRLLVSSQDPSTLLKAHAFLREDCVPQPSALSELWSIDKRSKGRTPEKLQKETS